jgi:hypothetical protein
MKNVQELYQEALEEIKSLGIKTGNIVELKINKHLKVNIGQYVNLSDFSDEILENENDNKEELYNIEIAEFFINECESEKLIKQTLIHLILHTCEGCQNHGRKWKKLAEEMNDAYGYNITHFRTEEEYQAALEVANDVSALANNRNQSNSFIKTNKPLFGINLTKDELNTHFIKATILYKDYKDENKGLSIFPIEKDSYNKETKTIDVYIPKFIYILNQINNESCLYALKEYGNGNKDLDIQTDIIQEYSLSLKTIFRWILEYDVKNPEKYHSEFYSDAYNELQDRICALVNLYRMTANQIKLTLDLTSLRIINNFIITDNTIEEYFSEFEITYQEYKREDSPYKRYPAKKNSYNAISKTISIYIPKFFQL